MRQRTVSTALLHTGGFVPTKLREFLESELGLERCDDDIVHVQEVRAYVDREPARCGDFTVVLVLDIGTRVVSVVVDVEEAVAAPNPPRMAQNIH